MSAIADSFVNLNRFTCCSIVSSRCFGAPDFRSLWYSRVCSHAAQLRKGAKATILGVHVERANQASVYISLLINFTQRQTTGRCRRPRSPSFLCDRSRTLTAVAAPRTLFLTVKCTFLPFSSLFLSLFLRSKGHIPFFPF
ncbi:hypothetical protein PUN28_014772 [Cardiocondyla obscurior]|uniref:Uncharacterized protein n=1 Tax=Cardiocondyla obscurior TaxID=286306 RepID=A0AAW2EVB8_9HYME